MRNHNRCILGCIMDGTLYQVVAALISVMLIAIICYFWNDPDHWRKFKKESTTPSIGLMADHQHPPNVAPFPLRTQSRRDDAAMALERVAEHGLSVGSEC
ncbi:MAG TPA: hypothetical protein VLJ17_15045 [Xanthobacteraceae bacterium]|nr:hypothetical protein [Xanthobacteraceae bacterium]